MIKQQRFLVSYRKLSTYMSKAIFERNPSTFRWTNSPYYIFLYMYKAHSNGPTTFIVAPRRD